MKQFPLEVVEDIIFHMGDFYTYVALGFQRQAYTDTLTWIGGGPGVVLSECLRASSTTFCADKEEERASTARRVDNLRVLNYLRNYYSDFLTVDIVLTKAVQTKQPHVVRRVSMIWRDCRESTMAIMAAATCNFWWAVQFLRCSTSSPSSTSHRSNKNDDPLYMRICNAYHVVHGAPTRVNYKIRKPLSCLAILQHHPDPSHLATILSDDVFMALHRSQPFQPQLLHLAARLGKVQFLRAVCKRAPPNFLIFTGLLKTAVRGLSPKMSAELYVEFARQHRPLLDSTTAMMDVYGGNDNYMYEIEAVFSSHPYDHAGSGRVTVNGRLELLVARENIPGLCAYCTGLSEQVKDAGHIVQTLLARRKVHLLSQLVDAGRGGGRGKSENECIPKVTLERYKARIGAALVVASGSTVTLAHVNTELEKLGLEMLVPDSTFMHDIFLMVDDDQLRLRMLREGFVTTNRGPLLAIKGYTVSNRGVDNPYQRWTRFVQFEPFFSRAGRCLDNRAQAVLDAYKSSGCRNSNNNNIDSNNRQVARALRKYRDIQCLPTRMVINTHENSDLECQSSKDVLAWKELIDWVLLDEHPGTPGGGESSLRLCNRTTNQPGNGQSNGYMQLTRGFWGPWYYATHSGIPSTFESFEDVLICSDGVTVPIEKARETTVDRTIAFLDTNMSISDLLGNRWMERMQPWIKSLDTNLYCGFMASYLSRTQR